MKPSTTSRLQKIISSRGFCSRRKAEELILEGKVFVNGKKAELGEKFDDDCEIVIGDEKIAPKNSQITIAFYKPVGYECTKKVFEGKKGGKFLAFNKNQSSNKSKSIYDILPPEFSHLNYAGRLDKDSEGLMILSSDGGLVQKLSHPSFGHKKTYEIRVKGSPIENDLLPLKSGKLKLDGKILAPMQFEIRGDIISLELSEGRKRQIRRVMDLLGFPVLYLCRKKIGELGLDEQKPGEWKILTENEIQRALSQG